MDKKDKINFDLDFLEKDAPDANHEKSANPQRKTETRKNETVEPSKVTSSGTQRFLIGVVIVVVLIILGIFTDGDNTSPTTIDTFPPAAPNTNTEVASDTITDIITEGDIPVVTKKTLTEDPIITPTPTLQKTNYEICQEMNGPFGTYDATDNTCGCAWDYYYGAVSKQCVSYTESRDQSCAAKYPGTSFLKVDPADGKNICDCKIGSYWNNERTACYSQTAFNQSCQSNFGSGSYSTTEDGRRVCDCSYGYSFNIDRNMCITTASINAMCERDVGRNSRYAGTVTDGKYDCTEPY